MKCRNSLTEKFALSEPVVRASRQQNASKNSALIMTFRASDDIGGNWYHKNPNGMSACYQSLHIDTSKHRLAFEDYPVPDNWPDFPHHSQMLAYFNDYVDHFDFGAHHLQSPMSRMRAAMMPISGMFRYRRRKRVMTRWWLPMVIIGIAKSNRIRRPLQWHTDAQPCL